MVSAKLWAMSSPNSMDLNSKSSLCRFGHFYAPLVSYVILLMFATTGPQVPG
jgi:hypothetical protein